MKVEGEEMSLERINAADFAAISSRQEKAALRQQGSNTEKIAERTTINSKNHCTTKSEKPQGFIEGFLQHGAENAIQTETLLALTGLNVRQLRQAVEKERRNGTLILTGYRCGYFLPAEGDQGREEILTFYSIQRAKALSLLKTISNAKKALADIDGQETLDL